MAKSKAEESATQIVALTMQIDQARSLKEIRLATRAIRLETREWYRRELGKQRTQRCRQKKRGGLQA